MQRSRVLVAFCGRGRPRAGGWSKGSSGTPPGCRRRGLRNRGYRLRAPQPPATFSQPSGLGPRRRAGRGGDEIRAGGLAMVPFPFRLRQGYGGQPPLSLSPKERRGDAALAGTERGKAAGNRLGRGDDYAEATLRSRPRDGNQGTSCAHSGCRE